MTAKSFTATWTWDEEPETYGPDVADGLAGLPTGNVRMSVPTVACPDGYLVNVPVETSDFQRALTVQAIWDAQGQPVA
jgi:hypothetical protein